MSPLAVVGRIEIPPSVLRHRFVAEALACTMVLERSDDVNRRVVGTANTKAIELYGWASDVDSHVDATGFIYLVALNDGKTTINVWPDGEDILSEWMPAGTVIRLDDFKTHWTEDSQSRVCAFVGSFDAPCDAEAIAILQAGIDVLARGDYYGAPRVQSGMRAMMPDECLVPNQAFDACEPMLLADAIAKDIYYEQCSCCYKPAVRLDGHWPYAIDQSYCADHLRGKE